MTKWFGRFTAPCLRALAPGALFAVLAQTAAAQALAAAVLPSGRSVTVGATATAYATMINTGSAAATSCQIAPATQVAATFSYQTTNSATNAPTGAPNTPANIAAGAAQSFVFSFTPTAAFAPTDIALSFTCSNTTAAPVVPGVNTLLLSASAAAVPDVIAIAATTTNDGVAHLPSAAGTGFFSAAAVNIGAAATLTVTPVVLGGAQAQATVCETNPATAACFAGPAASVATNFAQSSVHTYTVFIAGGGSLITPDFAAKRVRLDFKDAGGAVRGATSVAVCTVGAAGCTSAPVFTSPAAVSVQENAAGVVYRAVATDADSPTVAISITGGADAAKFTFSGLNRELRFVAQPDFEAPTDANADNVYEVQLTASDGPNNTNLALRVTVTNVNSTFRLRRIASGVSAPMQVVGVPDGSGRIAVALRSGRIRLMNPDTGVFQTADLLNISSEISTVGERGLLGIAFSPNFASDRLIYINMNNAAGNSELRRYRVPGADTADASSVDIIAQVTQTADDSHKGGFLAFSKDGFLLWALGDGGTGGATAQDRNSLLGKLLRLDVSSDAFPADANKDYAIPPGNAFASGGGAPEIYAMGLRNPFRGGVDPVTGDIFIGDVGQNEIEEVDRLPFGTTGLVNYGWNRREGSQAYQGGANDPGYTLPVTEYPHGGGDLEGESIIGGTVYRGPIDGIQAQYFFGDFVDENVWSIPIASLTVGSVFPAANFTIRNTAFTPDVGVLDSLVDFGVDEKFNLYVVALTGEIYRLEPT